MTSRSVRAYIRIMAVLLVIGLVGGLSAGCKVTPEGPKELIIAKGSDVTGLTTELDTSVTSRQVSKLIQEALMWTDDSMNIVPALASDWEVLDDTTLLVNLRQDVKFTNGEPFNAAVVKYSIDRMLNPPDPRMMKVTCYADMKAVASVEIVNDYSVKIHLKAPTPTIIFGLSGVSMIPPQYMEQVGLDQFLVKPVGTGPFKLVEWKTGEYIKLEKNADYWGTVPKIDLVTFRIIPDALTRVAAVEAGEAHIADNAPFSEATRLAALPKVNVMSSISARAMYIAFDLLKKSGPIDDVRVRQALNYAVDKDAIINQILDGYGTKLQAQFTTPEHFGFNSNLQAYPYDVEKARALLAAAGYANGFTVDFYTSVGRHARDKEIAEAVVGYLADVGVTANLKPIEWGIYITMMKDKSASPLALCGMMAFHFDGGMQLEIQTTGAVYSWYSNPEVDALYEQSNLEMDPGKRLLILQEMSRIMRDDPPALWLHQVHYLYAVRDNVVGWSPRPDEMMNLLEVDIRN